MDFSALWEFISVKCVCPTQFFTFDNCLRNGWIRTADIDFQLRFLGPYSFRNCVIVSPGTSNAAIGVSQKTGESNSDHGRTGFLKRNLKAHANTKSNCCQLLNLIWSSQMPITTEKSHKCSHYCLRFAPFPSTQVLLSVYLLKFAGFNCVLISFSFE